MKKRFIIAALAAVILLMPLIAIPSFGETVSSVEITNVREPIAGTVPDAFAFCRTTGYEISENYNRESFVNGVGWYDVKAAKFLSPGEKFESGKKYRVYIYLQTTSGNSFAVKNGASSVSATINKNKATVVDIGASGYKNSEKQILIFYEFPASQYKTVTSVTGKITVPTTNMYPTYDADADHEDFFLDKEYSESGYLNGVRWHDVAAERDLDDSDRLLYGREYRVSLRIKAAPGRVFALKPNGMPDVTATLNGASALTVPSGSDSAAQVIDLFYTFTPGKTVINTVTLTGLAVPDADKTADPSAVPYDTFYSISDSYFTEVSSGKKMTSTSYFQENGQYRYTVKLSAAPGCEFAAKQSVTATVNGNEMTVTERTATSLTAECVFTALPSKYISSIEITGVTAPAPGAMPAYGFTVAPGEKAAKNGSYDDSGTYYIKNSVQWLIGNSPMPFDKAFPRGASISATFFVKAKPGFEFRLDNGGNIIASAYVNGKPAQISGDFISNEEAYITYEFDSFPAFEVTDIFAMITAPEAGKSAGRSVICPTGNYKASAYSSGGYINGVLWKDLDTGKDLVSGETFRKGHSYRVYILLNPAEGNKFSAGSLSCKINNSGCGYIGGELQQDQITLYADFTLPCDHSHYQYDYDFEKHWKNCLDCFDAFDTEGHEFDGGKTVAGITVYTCKICGYETSQGSQAGASVTISLPEPDFTKTFGNIIAETLIRVNGADLREVAYTLAHDGESATLLYNAKSATWSTPGGESPDALKGSPLLPFTDYLYTVEFTVEGGDLQKETVTLTDPNAAAKRMNIVKCDKNSAAIEAEYTTKGNIIPRIELEGVTAPVSGSSPSTGFHIVKSEGIEPIDLEWNTDKSFECGRVYTATIKVRAVGGWAFAPETDASVEGCSEVETVIDGDIATISATFPATVHDYGQDGKCTVCGEPKEGQQTDKPATETEKPETGKPTTDAPATDKPATDGEKSTATPTTDPKTSDPGTADKDGGGKDGSDTGIIIAIITGIALAAAALVTVLIIRKKKS